ncbi:MAG: phage holin family protein [Puniceicoccales bacterium]|nr:phage holin family protein [Puniceicoccales bacterium]
MDTSLSWGRWFREWAVLALGILIATHIVSGIHYDKTSTLVLAVLILSLLNSAIRPILTTVFMLLSLPLLLATLGLGILIIMWLVNSLLLYFTGAIIPNFTVDTFGDAMWGALWISIVSFALNTLLGGKSTIIKTSTRPNTPKQGGQSHLDDDDVIDI